MKKKRLLSMLCAAAMALTAAIAPIGNSAMLPEKTVTPCFLQKASY